MNLDNKFLEKRFDLGQFTITTYPYSYSNTNKTASEINIKLSGFGKFKIIS